MEVLGVFVFAVPPSVSVSVRDRIHSQDLLQEFTSFRIGGKEMAFFIPARVTLFMCALVLRGIVSVVFKRCFI